MNGKCPKCGSPLQSSDGYDDLFRCGTIRNDGGVYPKIECYDRVIATLKARVEELEEVHQMQLAGISTASVQNTPTSIKHRIGRQHPYWTVAYSDVCVAVDREMKLIERVEELDAAIRFAAGIVSTTDGWSNKHPEECYLWILEQAKGHQ